MVSCGEFYIKKCTLFGDEHYRASNGWLLCLPSTIVASRCGCGCGRVVSLSHVQDINMRSDKGILKRRRKYLGRCSSLKISEKCPF